MPVWSHSPARARGRSLHRGVFLREFLRHPRQVGSAIPSSRSLEQRLVGMAGVSSARVVVELGPGTGGVTRAILDALPASARLLAIELNPEFAALLARQRDGRLIVHAGSAEGLRGPIAAHALDRPDVVLSGIPFSTMPRARARRILARIWSSLAPGGRFVAYQLRSCIADLGRDLLGSPQMAIELRNLPPVRVYRWSKPEEGGCRATPAALGHRRAG